MKATIIIVCVSIELIVIIFLGFLIYKNKIHTLGGISVNPIKKDSIVFNQTDELKYFYEPKPNSILYDTNSWLTTKPKHTINSDSLNADHEYTTDKASDTFRIITLGDSYTFGIFINTEENYPSQLERLLNAKLACKNIKKFEVINLGVSGYDIPYEVERFKIRGLKYSPDLVLWFISQNQSFESINDIVLPLEQKYRESMEKSGTYQKYISQGLYYPAGRKAREELAKTIGEKKILEIISLSLSKFNQLYSNPLIIFGFFHKNEYRNFVSNFIAPRKQSYYYQDLINIYDVPNAILPDGHPSKTGGIMIANDLFNYLSKNKIIPCN